MNVVEREFNQLAPVYEENRLAPWYKAHAQEILRHCGHIGDGDLLDVGCGTGYFLREYLRDRPAIRGVGIDTSQKMIEIAREKARSEGINNVEFIHADWEQVDPEYLHVYHFSEIFCANAFHYFTDPQAATDKIFEQLAPGGSFYLLERNKSRSLLTAIWGMLHTLLIRDQVSFYRPGELKEVLSEAGFESVTTLSEIRKYFWKHKLYTSVLLIRGSRP